MVKYIYQAVALVFIFAGALFLFGRNMETDMEEKGVTEAITDETYPYLQLQTQGHGELFRIAIFRRKSL